MCRGKAEEDISVPSVSISLLTERPLTIGDPIDIAISIYHDKKVRVEYPGKEEDFSPFILKEFRVRKGRIGKSHRRTIIIYTLTIYNTGTFTIKPLRIQAGESEFLTRELKITILSILPQETKNPQIKEITPPVSAGINPLFILFLIMGVGVSLAIFLYLKYFFKKHKLSSPKPKQGISVVDPFNYSVTQLKELRTGFRERRLNIREVYFSLSYILRFFIGAHLNTHALQMTTRELEKYLKSIGKHRIPIPLLIGILKRSDIVKFARENPLLSKVEGDIEKSIKVIKKVNSFQSEQQESPDKEEKEKKDEF